MKTFPLVSWLQRVAMAVGLSTQLAWAQSDLSVYTDHLVNGFQDWSWATRALDNTSPVHSGSKSIRVNATAGQGIYVHHSDFSAASYSNMVFWAHGGPGGGQKLTLSAVVGGQILSGYALTPLTANAWKAYTIPLSTLHAAQATNLNGWILQLQSGGGSGVFYLDDLTLTARPAPSVVHVTVDATHPLRPVDRRWTGVNVAVWDGNLASAATLNLVKGLGTTLFRFPGGSLSDEYHWASNRSLTNTWQWNTSFHQFAPQAKAVGADVMITVNYGTGTPAEAAAWVRDSNITNHYGFRYWEIGNENYGTWETDTNNQPHEPYTYATRAALYYQQMKAVDPTIKIGIVVVDGENNYSNGYTGHTATNSRTGIRVNGWTPIVLTRLKALGIVPDFLVYHYYPEYTGQESDPLLLQTSTWWASAAADLRQQIKDYYGAGGDGIELLATENNSNAGDQGRQSTSLVNGLYLADSLGQLMKTEFNSFVWWDLRNGSDTKGSFDPTLYGWRTVGDLGLIDATTNGYPAYYAFKLMHQFLSKGGTVLPATADDPGLAAYALRDGNGGLQLLVINKYPKLTNAASIAITGFLPLTNATVTRYGIPQDDAARTHSGSLDLTTNSVGGISSTFTYNFPPYSLTLLALNAQAPLLRIQTAPPAGSPPTFELRGQPGATVELQQSLDLSHWRPILTNRLSSSDGVLVQSPGGAVRDGYWRGIYRPDLN